MKPPLYFLDGFARSTELLVLAAQYNDHADVDASRVLLRLGQDWLKVDFDDDIIRSVAYRDSSGTLYLLGSSGAIHTIGGRDPAFTTSTIKGTKTASQVVDPDERGELTRVRVVNDRVLACGMGGQAFELIRGKWVSIGLLGDAPACPDFEDISVDSAGFPIAVGSKGTICVFTPKGPHLLDSSTNSYLSSIVVDSLGRRFVCGNGGVVFCLDGDSVVDLSVGLHPTRNLWSLALCGDRLFVSEPDRLLSRTLNSTWAIEAVSEDVRPSFNRLLYDAGALWSFGPDHVFVKQAGAWSRVLVPGNEVKP